MFWDERLTDLLVSVQEAPNPNSVRWTLRAAWLTVNGSWGDVPGWARQWQLDTLGGDHHVFGRAIHKDGRVAQGAGFVLSWPDGADQVTPEPDGWANLPINAGYNWQETSGPYSWAKFGNADKLVGIGLPYPPLPWWVGDAHAEGGVHVSVFGLWQERDPHVEPPGPEPEPDDSQFRRVLDKAEKIVDRLSAEDLYSKRLAVQLYVDIANAIAAKG